MSRRWSVFALIVCGWACGCGRSRGDSEPVGATPPAGARGPDAGPSAAPVASASAAAEGPATAWKGSYKSAAGGLYIPPDWKGVHYVLKDTSEGLGDGHLAFRVDPQTGRVAGTLDGPLGPATIEGVDQSGKVFATIRRSDPADRGFTGTLVATLAGDRGEGSMNLSQAEVNAIRAATVVLSLDGNAR
jgi:hypothetical protein